MMLRADNDNLTYDEFEAGAKPNPSVAPVRMDAQIILQGRVPGGFIVLQKTVKPGPDGMPVLTAAPLAMMPHPECPPNRPVAVQPSVIDLGSRHARPAFIRGVVVNQPTAPVEIC
ncbi:hypothetical protein [Microvirga calopogonii]|uniref:hypothetical protein n=1 Tax=Microvirga calopogonii TaxID=2078013 RepID=UPI000E0D8519|nr:hypothetical protein [Microvirga calopogonii]